MKKPLISLMALTASIISSTAFAASNMESPLYMPQNREVYLKTAAAMMYKTVEGTEATIAKQSSGNLEFPVWRFFGDIGYGITDRLDIHGHFGYTKDGEIDRKGMHRGRIGLMYRILTDNDPFVLDLYGDAYLSGISPMKGTYKRYGTSAAFNFDNYSNGRWGAIVGTRFGKTWNDFTLAAHVEYLQTFGNHNNKIALDPALNMSMIGFPSEIEVDLKPGDSVRVISEGEMKGFTGAVVEVNVKKGRVKFKNEVLGGAILGLAQMIAAYLFGTAYQTLAGYIVLLILLTVRPQGLLSKKVRK